MFFDSIHVSRVKKDDYVNSLNDPLIQTLAVINASYTYSRHRYEPLLAIKTGFCVPS